MTVMGLIRVLARRWYIVFAGMLLAAVSFLLMQRVSGVYTATTAVLFVAPGEETVGASNEGLRESLVDFTASIERIVNDGKQVDRLASPDAPLFGAGIRKGYSVQLPNLGGQWQNSFSRPELDVQVVGPNAEWVRNTLGKLLDRIEAATGSQQVDIAPTDRIAANAPAASDVPLVHLGGTRSGQLRAVIALGALGFGISAAAAVVIDRLLRRRIPTPIPHAAGNKRRRASFIQSHTTARDWMPPRPMNRPQGENAP